MTDDSRCHSCHRARFKPGKRRKHTCDDYRYVATDSHTFRKVPCLCTHCYPSGRDGAL